MSALKRCAFLTMDSLEGFVSDDELACGPMAEAGWQVQFVPWRRPGTEWNEFEAVVIRSTWDYQHAPEEFLGTLGRIEASGARLENPLRVVRWNLRKTYLEELETAGVPIVPTRRMQHFDPVGLTSLFDYWGIPELVVKPVIGANADLAYRLSQSGLARRISELEQAYQGREFLVQPFVEGIQEEGEFSLFFFAGEFSHAICKIPKPGDFRVQEEHGGDIRPHIAGKALLEAGQNVLPVLPEVPLYARVDLVRWAGGFAVMEVELIEPALYFRTDPRAARRFARVFSRRMSLPSV